MSEGKNTTAEGQSSKRSVSSQKSSAKKTQKERVKPDVQAKSVEEVKSAFSLAKKVDDMAEEIEGKPIKSFEKKEQEKLLQSYEKLISKMVREINNSRL
ncbi:MAG: hypothetical protein DYG83_06635 [Candidatus Brocadia sp. AMX2]|uniref:Uncharacterized protein n=1 Tax=Candidatus Brocadia sinica JPN1 TaxID=1197129 RepID=A0ABQ0K1M3_9BACT|nr:MULTISPECIES: hypothetical protein [Brocadia]KXK28998.1 MAG: hypothetical protein UZ01_02442 [Candidatus Brocadia sinica]MBC6932502.1 hypothetical protein [Candidatus Brocadia sp.]MBL1168887.1 hypothetical protein [Candidatus Brocadia sp. AMX1]NOG42764.1 hypothetical protein [Planctomycetota bacterium]KAA0245179.1 MAG: hypothetical protein EDM70_03930 [Candidatus Brocadia sp. AMX2]